MRMFRSMFCAALIACASLTAGPALAAIDDFPPGATLSVTDADLDVAPVVAMLAITTERDAVQERSDSSKHALVNQLDRRATANLVARPEVRAARSGGLFAHL